MTRAHWGMLALLLVACTPPAPTSGRFEVRDPYAFEAPLGGTAAAYGVFVNGRDSALVVDSITSSASPAVSAHSTREENGLVSMVPIERLVIPAHDSVTFAPGGSHLMLERLTRDLKADDRTDLTFWIAGQLPVTFGVIVRPYGS